MTQAPDFRYKKLGYVALNVTDMERSVAFYRDMVGLQLNEQVEQGPAFFSCSADHHNVVLHPGGEPGLKRVGWEMEQPEDFDKAYAHFQQLGLDPQLLDADACRALRQGRTMRLREPHTGLLFEYYDSVLEHGSPYQPTVANIARLGHVVLNVENWQETVAFFRDSMNYRISDFVDGFIAFMRCYPNPYHHSLGIGNAAATGKGEGLNHVNFMVTDIDDVGRGLVRCKREDVPVVFGPGRHPPSGSIFLYFLDPDGMTLEYSFGMEEFPEQRARKPRILEARPDSLDYWGNVPDPRFAATGKFEKVTGA